MASMCQARPSVAGTQPLDTLGCTDETLTRTLRAALVCDCRCGATSRDTSPHHIPKCRQRSDETICLDRRYPLVSVRAPGGGKGQNIARSGEVAAPHGQSATIFVRLMLAVHLTFAMMRLKSTSPP
jgi:hypothetical protein